LEKQDKINVKGGKFGLKVTADNLYQGGLMHFETYGTPWGSARKRKKNHLSSNQGYSANQSKATKFSPFCFWDLELDASPGDGENSNDAWQRSASTREEKKVSFGRAGP